VPVQCKKALPRNERERHDGEQQKINKNKRLYKIVSTYILEGKKDFRNTNFTGKNKIQERDKTEAEMKKTKIINKNRKKFENENMVILLIF
jgi:hypothetical protein